jgi:hypothetical protein
MVAETPILAAALPNASDAQAAVQELRERGFSQHDISVLYTMPAIESGPDSSAERSAAASWGEPSWR